MPKVHLKTAWIVFDEGKPVDILSARMTFNDVVEYAKDLYRSTRMNLTEKALLAHYNSGTTVREAAFSNVPMETQFTSSLYRDLKASEENAEEIGGAKHRMLAKRFADGPQYVILGTTPAIEIRKVMNLAIEGDDAENDAVIWAEPRENGTTRSERFSIPKDVEDRKK